MRVESVTGGLRSLSLSVGLSLSSSRASVVRPGLSGCRCGRAFHACLDLAQRAVHALHRGCHLPGRQLAEPICCGELLDLCGVLREQRDKVFERKPGRFGRVTDPDKRLCRVRHRHLRNGAVQFRELRLNTVQVRLGPEEVGEEVIAGVATDPRVEAAGDFREDVERRRQVADVLRDVLALKGLEHRVQRRDALALG